jgi:class 3 adenylate cyclase
MADERRIVTILFADVAGSTALGETLDPEDMRAIMAGYYAVACEVIEAHGGTLEKFIGDAVMAIFGLPRAHGDDAERALAAAETLRKRLKAEPALALLELRFGVSTGEVVASRERSSGGQGDFLVTGDAVNLAARLQQAAGLNEILCSERTARAAGRRFAFDAPRLLQLRGKAQHVNGYSLTGPMTEPPAHATTATLPMIGRDADLEQLQLTARRAFAEGRPQLVSVIAPAGTGKTRLVEEFLARLPGDAGSAAPLVAIAQCLPYGQRLTFWPLRAVLHRFVGVTGDAPVEDLQRRLADWLAERGVADAAYAAELLASTVGAAEVAQPDRVGMFNAWRSAVQAAGSAGPVVIVFEDLHWSSDTLLDLVEHVMQPWAQLPILMIALTRPELLDRRPTWGGGKRNYTSIALEPLGDAPTGELVRRLLQTDDDDVVRSVVERAEGNPFYAGELVRAVMEQAVDTLDRVALAHALAHLPDTVHAAVLARLDLLPPEEREALQLGAVMGRAFGAEAVAVLGRIAASTAAESCRLLVERDLLRPSGEGYAFRHILIREVAYQTLPRAERARLHGVAAGWLDERAGGREDALAELIAFHYREAATLAGGAADAQLKRRAVDWLARAAESAFSGAATIEGLGHLRAAISLAELARLPELYERLGSTTQSGSAADEPLRTALRLSEEQGRPAEDQLRILGRVLMFATRAQGSVATRMSDDEMAALRARGRALLAHCDPSGLSAGRFLAADSCYPFWMNGAASETEVQQAIADAQRAIEIAGRHGDANLLSEALDSLTGTGNTRGDYSAGLALARRRVALGRKLSFFERLDAHSMVTWACTAIGDLAGADASSAEGLALVQPGQEPAWTLHLVSWRIYTLTLMGRWDEACTFGRRALELWEEMNRETAGYALRGLVAACQVSASRGDSALSASLREAVESMLSQFPGGSQATTGFPASFMPLLHPTAEGLERTFATRTREAGVPDVPERLLSTMSDRGWTVVDSITAPRLAFAESRGLVPLQVQLCRAIGLRDRDEGALRRALASALEIGAGSVVPRLRFELATLQGDSEASDAAIDALEAIGDRGQIALYLG